MKHTSKYNEKLKACVYEIISSEINSKYIDVVVNHDLRFHLTNKGSSKFQVFYFKTISNDSYLLNSNNFFREFKSQYSLQGIDNSFLDRLEKRKVEILDMIHNDDIVQLYFDTFRKAKVKYKDTLKEKDLGSFFAKLVHTFSPENYCALDNPIKNYLGLGKESFFVAFSVISQAYKDWSYDNRDLIVSMRQRLSVMDTDKKLPNSKITDLKLLDLIFWTKADRNNRIKL